MKMFTKDVGNIKLPVIGLGTYNLPSCYIEGVLEECISRGVNYIDSAYKYENEAIIGKALRKINVQREKFIIGTKLSYKQQISQPVNKSVSDSLRNLGMEYIDLYYIHSPRSNTYCESWLQLLEIKERGVIKELGVCNFSKKELEELKDCSGEYPAINQIEVNVGHYPAGLIGFCKEKGIAIQASCPLGRMDKRVIHNQTVGNYENKYERSFTQISLRWLYQDGIISIPKTQNVAHLYENISIFDFDIEESDVEAIRKIATCCSE